MTHLIILSICALLPFFSLCSESEKNQSTETSLAPIQTTTNDDEKMHSAIEQFARLINHRGRQFDKRSKHHTNLDYAQVYFNYLYTHGSRETKKALTLLAFELEVVLNQKSWFTEKKYLAFNAFLTNTFGTIEATLKTKLERDKLQRLYKHLQAGISPTVIGRQEAIRNLPWKRLAFGALAIATGIYAYKTNALRRLQKNIIQSFEAIGHVGENLKEASREREAFFAHIAHDKIRGPIRHWDPKTEKYYFLVKNNGTNQRNAEELKKIEQEKKYTDRSQWLIAPAGILDRTVTVLEAAKPLLPQFSEKLLEATEEQKQWFIAKGISVDRETRKWVPVFWHENGEEKHEMRYAEDKPMSPAESYDSASNNDLLWQDHNGKWYRTHLPPRNIAERILVTTEKALNALDAPHIKGLITTITRQLDDNQQELIRWMKNNGLIATENQKPYPLAQNVTLHCDEATKKFYYKKTLADDTTTIIPFPESMFERLISTAGKLTEQLGNQSSPTGALVTEITKQMKQADDEYNQWLESNGLKTAGGWENGVTIHTDPHTHTQYFTKKDATGAIQKFNPPISPTGNLFNALGTVAATTEKYDITAFVKQIQEYIDVTLEYALASLDKMIPIHERRTITKTFMEHITGQEAAAQAMQEFLKNKKPKDIQKSMDTARTELAKLNELIESIEKEETSTTTKIASAPFTQNTHQQLKLLRLIRSKTEDAINTAETAINSKLTPQTMEP